MEEKLFRNKIHWFTFCFSILVIWVHSFNSELYLGKTPTAGRISQAEHIIGELGQIAAPGFFMISAYLFYRNFVWGKLWEKWESRIRKILVPFIAWNFLYYLGYVIASRIYLLRDVVGKGVIPFDVVTAADAVVNYRYNYVFWYMYQLILLIILTPALYCCLKNRYTALVFFVVLAAAIHERIVLPRLNLDALAYYSASACVAIHGRKAAEGAWTRKRLLLGGILAVSSALLYLSAKSGGSILSLVSCRLFAPMGLWLMADETKLTPAWPWMKNNFFLYAVHFAFVRLLNKTGAMLLPHHPAVPLSLFIAMPFLMVVLSYYLALALRRISHPIWTLLTGGREY